MARMTLHEAQTAVDAIRKRNNLQEPGWRVSLDDPMGEAIRYAVIASDAGFYEHEKAAKEISAALLAYKAHLDFEAGKAFADAATERRLRWVATVLRSDDFAEEADRIREGLHYAEPEPEET